MLFDKLETGFTIVFMVFLVVFLLSMMLFIANTFSFSGLDEILAVSPKTPWGIITSLFVHTDEAHLYNNMIALFLFLLFLVGSNVFLPKEEIKIRILEALLIIFPIPVALNLLTIILLPEVRMIGSSSIVYTLEGVCLGFSLFNALKIRKYRRYNQEERKVLLTLSLSNLIVFIGLLMTIVFSPIIFLDGRSNVIIRIHSWAFTLGFIVILILDEARRYRKKPKTNLDSHNSN